MQLQALRKQLQRSSAQCDSLKAEVAELKRRDRTAELYKKKVSNMLLEVISDTFLNTAVQAVYQVEQQGQLCLQTYSHICSISCANAAYAKSHLCIHQSPQRACLLATMLMHVFTMQSDVSRQDKGIGSPCSNGLDQQSERLAGQGNSSICRICMYHGMQQVSACSKHHQAASMASTGACG